MFGLAPALQVARTSVGSILKQGGRGSTGSRQMRGFSSALVVLELALTLVLLVGAGLMARSFMALTRREHRASSRTTWSRCASTCRAPTTRRAEVAGAVLRAADAAAGQPARRRRRRGDDERAAVRRCGTREVLVDGRADAGRGKRLESRLRRSISPSFFDTVGVPLRRGRGFDARDGGKGGEVAIVNERFAARHFPGEDPIGRRIR